LRVFFRRGPKVPPPRPADLPFDDAARDALGGATAEAQKANVGAVHAEHLLYALLADPAGPAARAFQRLGHEPDVVRRRMQHASPPRACGLRAPVLPFADDVKGAIEFAMREARAAGLHQVGAGELLLGVLQSPMGIPARVFGQMEITATALRAALKAGTHSAEP
jgi:ATP-dependent Clp protease ATP-binding subunit ClpA